MADKRKLHHWLVIVKGIKTWQLIIVLVLLGGLTAFMLRQNNLGMVERRNQVKQADESANDVVGALSELQHYVTGHMNTSLGEGVFLEHTYQRAYDTAVQQAASAITANTQGYKDVEANCRQQYVKGGSFNNYIKCVENGLKALTPGSDPLAAFKAPPQELFKYNFMSPIWSPDLAGFATLTTLLVALMIAIRTVSYIALVWVLKLRSKN